MFKDGTRKWAMDDRQHTWVYKAPFTLHKIHMLTQIDATMPKSSRSIFNDPGHDLGNLQLGLAGLQREMAPCIDPISYPMLLMYLPIQFWLCRWAARQQAVIVEAPGMSEPSIFFMSSYTHTPRSSPMHISVMLSYAAQFLKIKKM